jgi:hypothetical protein
MYYQIVRVFPQKEESIIKFNKLITSIRESDSTVEILQAVPVYGSDYNCPILYTVGSRNPFGKDLQKEMNDPD